MPLLAARHKLINRIDRDRAAMERIGKAAALRIGLQIRTLAYAAWRTTRDARAVRDVVRAAMIGDDKLETPGIVDLVKDAMLAGHLQGWRRTAINVKDHVDTSGIKLSTAYDGAIEFLRHRLQLSEGELADLTAQYDAAALRVVETSASSLEDALQQAILDSTQQGEGVKGGIRALRDAFNNEGFTSGSDYQLEAIFRTQTQTAYHAGRWESLTDPALNDLLWGFEYTAIRDDRTTHEICLPLDGMRRTKDDEVWTRLWPPNHWNCRSTPLELFGDNDETDVPAGVEAQDGFGFNPGMVFGSSDLALAMWDESKHPRGAGGRFGAGSGGGRIKKPKIERQAAEPTIETVAKPVIKSVSKKTEKKIAASFTAPADKPYHADAVPLIERMHKWSQQRGANMTLLTKSAEQIAAKDREVSDHYYNYVNELHASSTLSKNPVYFAEKGKILWQPQDETTPEARAELERRYKAKRESWKKVEKIQARVNNAHEEIRQKAFNEIVAGNTPARLRTMSEINDHPKVAEIMQGVETFKQMAGDIGMGNVGVRHASGKLKLRSYHEAHDPKYGASINMGPNAGASVTVHELGHHWEHFDPEVHKEAVDFLARRTKGEKPRKMKDILPGHNYENDEIATPDGFTSPYTGKIYSFPVYHNGQTTQEVYATEIVSMGLQQMHDDPIDFAKKDPDHFAFIVSLMRKYRKP